MTDDHGERARWRDLLGLSVREWRHHPARHAVALLAVALGVALAFSVHLINRSALAEFSAALRTTNGEPDLTLRAQAEGLPDALFDRVIAADGVLQASPVLELATHARRVGGPGDGDGRPGDTPGSGMDPGASRSGVGPVPDRMPIQVLGIDALRVAPLAADLLPRPAEGAGRLAWLDPALVFVNAEARRRLGLADGDTLALQAGPRWVRLRVAGSVAAGGAPLAVLDIAAAQHAFGRAGQLTRIDLRLAPGVPAAALAEALALPPGVILERPRDAEQRVSQLSRAYRVNLTVLALVALFVGAFLVYSVLALSVAQRTPAFALLGVLGLAARQRRALVLAECTLLGAAGSALGLAGGAALAAAALRWLAGDLGGGYFPGITPALRIDAASTAVFGALGTAAAVVGGWVPARHAARLPPAQALKGLGDAAPPRLHAWPGVALCAAGAALALAPPVAGLPLAAYASVACLLFGGVALVPAVVNATLAALPAPAGALPLLALRRARWQRHTAMAAVAGVVASLALSTALTVMVASFRDGVAAWLDQVLPADLYARSAASSAAAAQAWLAPEQVREIGALPGVARLQASRSLPLQLAPAMPPVLLIARELGDPAAELPLLDAPRPAAPGEVGVFVSEAMVALYGAHPGTALALPLAVAGGDAFDVTVRVRGVWRDYARQFGAVTMARADYLALTGDTRVNEIALWLAPGAEADSVMAALRARLPDPDALRFASTAELRAVSLRIFDRSFAVTTYLQAVAIAVGLVGVAASLSAQVMARRKEFGLLAHLGLTRREVTALVTGEAAAWLLAGCAIGIALGLAVSAVLVYVVNPQSFHWTMDLVLPGGRLAALASAVLLAGVATAATSARRAASRAAVLSVKEDW
jgi:putative ABC transport system permease protein